MPLYYGIDKQGQKAIEVSTENLQIHRIVICSETRIKDVLDNKDKVMSESPFCNMLDSLAYKLRIKEVLQEISDDLDGMTSLDLHNEE